MTELSLLGPLLQAFFTDYLGSQKRASPQTVIAYRDTFRLLLKFLHDQTGIEPAARRLTDLDASAILSFLDHIEQQRQNSVRSRNARLAAIRSFFRLVALRDPASLGIATRVLSIPVKRVDRKLVGYLTREEMDALLAAPDLSQWAGRRDHALLLTLYNSGARVSEIRSLERRQVCFGASTLLQLTGKGRKERAIPLWPKTARILQAWFNELDNTAHSIAFPSARGRPLSSDGVDYILQQAVERAAVKCSSLRAKRVTPHLLRHTTAMHLLQAGIDLAVIALWLGHENMETTHRYVEADLAMKERALAKLAPAGTEFQRFKAKDTLLAFLASL